MNRFDKLTSIGIIVCSLIIIIATIAEKEFTDWRLYAWLFVFSIYYIRLIRRISLSKRPENRKMNHGE
jgi:hypothetical protein